MPAYTETASAIANTIRKDGIEGCIVTGFDLPDWIIIRPCICVTEPCPCDDLDDILIWLPKDTRPISIGKRHGGEEVFRFELDDSCCDAKLMVQATIPMDLSTLRDMKRHVERGKSVAYSKKGGSGGKYKNCFPPKSVGAAIGCGAAIGWEIGGWLDDHWEEGTGKSLSDRLADKLYDWFG